MNIIENNRVFSIIEYLAKVDAYFCENDIWMNQASIAKLYNTSPQNITMHIKNIYKDGELDEDATCKEFLQVQTEVIKIDKKKFESGPNCISKITNREFKSRFPVLLHID